MNAETITNQAELILRNVSALVLEPAPRECLVCFVSRQLEQYGCNNSHRFAIAFRNHRAPAATALRKRLGSMGACCCDCEILLNAYLPALRLWVPVDLEGNPTSETDEDWYGHVGIPELMPPCTEVRRGSTQPCMNWERKSRFR